MAVIHVGENNFQEVINGNKTVLIDFFADWCGPCKRMAPLMERFAEEHPDIAVAKINIEDDPELAEQYGVMSIPTFVLIKDGKTAAKTVGVMHYEELAPFVAQA